MGLVRFDGAPDRAFSATMATRRHPRFTAPALA
jgi:hypothetical protein